MDTIQEPTSAAQIFFRAATKAGWKYNDFLVEEITQLLESWSIDLTNKVIKKLLYETRFTPKIAEIVKAKRDLAPESTGIGEFGKKHPWEEREEMIYGIINDYLRDFQLSPDMKEAISQGWEKDLERFAQSTATTMAWMIHGYQAPTRKYTNWGWDSMAVRIAHRDEYLRLLKHNYHYVRQNGIEVMRAMPGGQIPLWKNNIN